MSRPRRVRGTYSTSCFGFSVIADPQVLEDATSSSLHPTLHFNFFNFAEHPDFVLFILFCAFLR